MNNGIKYIHKCVLAAVVIEYYMKSFMGLNFFHKKKLLIFYNIFKYIIYNKYKL